MTENKRFKDCLIEFDKAKQDFNEGKIQFVLDVKEFMRDKGIPVKVLFFGNDFGLDFDINVANFGDFPTKIPLDVLTDFCNTFECEFEYTNCNGGRYIFSFDGLNMGY